MESLFELPILAYEAARSAHFKFQFDALNAMTRFLPGHKQLAPVPEALRAPVREAVLDLLKRDAQNIASGLYPISVLLPESPVGHLLRIPRIMADGLSIYSRRLRGRTTEFGPEAKELLSELPRYYRRCFHFQTDGYLSEHSASLYEHQVEMLFGGAADAMRRLILPALRAHFGKTDGKGLRFLEIAAGTGRTTRFVHQAFPKAKIVATDLSPAYLAQARKQLDRTQRIDFLQADGAALPFTGEQFDAVYSVFLFHELPMEARKQVLAESHRVLKPGGFFGFVDSLQKGDKPELDPLLEQFPTDYHEPFYRDYAAHPMDALITEAGFEQLSQDIGFFSKVVAAKRA